MLSDFEAYLMLQMRGKSCIESFLAKERMTLEELVRKSDKAKARWGLDQFGYQADALVEAIGTPIHEQVLCSNQTGPEFAGSTQRCYRLEPWSKVLFCVNRHPTGYAWGERFLQRSAIQEQADPINFKPWECVVSTIVAAASNIEVLDHWDYQKDLRVGFSSATGSRSFVGKFDFDLLQEWRPE